MEFLRIEFDLWHYGRSSIYRNSFGSLLTTAFALDTILPCMSAMWCSFWFNRTCLTFTLRLISVILLVFNFFSSRFLCVQYMPSNLHALLLLHRILSVFLFGCTTSCCIKNSSMIISIISIVISASKWIASTHIGRRALFSQQYEYMIYTHITYTRCILCI